MSRSWNDSGISAYAAYEDLERGLRVKLRNDGSVALAGADEAGIGVTLREAKAGEPVAVRLWNHPGTAHVTAAGAFDVAQPIYAAAGGKIQALPVAAGTYIQVGLSHEAALADGDIVEIQPHGFGSAVVSG